MRHMTTAWPLVALFLVPLAAADSMIDWSLDEMAIYAGGQVTLDWRSSVSGDVAARGTIHLMSESKVAGDLFAGGKVKTGWKSSFGVIQENIGGGQFDVLNVPEPNVPIHAGDHVYVGYRETRELAPGTYGNLVADYKGKVLLGAGTYFFNKIDFDSETTIALDTSAGPVNIFVTGKADFDWRSNVTRSGAGGALLVAGGEFRLQDENQFDASVLAGGRVDIGWRSHVTGQVFGQSKVMLDSEASVGGQPLANVPEPASVVLLLAGGLWMVRRR